MGAVLRPEPPPGSEPPAADRGFAEPASDSWFNAQRRGRPTRAEGALAAMLLVHKSSADELAQLQRAVQAQRVEWRRDGDAWAPPTSRAWGKGCIVIELLGRAMAITKDELPPFAELLRRDELADESAGDLHKYLQRLQLPRSHVRRLEGPARDSRGNASPRWTAALPEILECIEERRGGLRGLHRDLPRAAAATPPPARKELQAQLADAAGLIEQLREVVTQAQGAKRKARSDARADKKKAAKTKATVRAEGQAKLQRRMDAAIKKAREKEEKKA